MRKSRFLVVGLNHVAHREKSVLADDQEDPKFFERMKDHYEGKTGKEIILAKEEFLYLVSKGKIDNSIIKLISSKNNIYSAVINFYDSGFDLANRLGKATVTYRVHKWKKIISFFLR